MEILEAREMSRGDGTRVDWCARGQDKQRGGECYISSDLTLVSKKTGSLRFPGGGERGTYKNLSGVAQNFPECDMSPQPPASLAFF